MRFSNIFFLAFFFSIIFLLSIFNLSLLSSSDPITTINNTKLGINSFTLEVKDTTATWEKSGNSYTPILSSDKYIINKIDGSKVLKPIPTISFKVNLLEETRCSNGFYATECVTTRWDFSKFENKNIITNKTIIAHYPSIPECFFQTFPNIFKINECKGTIDYYEIKYEGTIKDLDPLLIETYSAATSGFFNITEATNIGIADNSPTLFMDFNIPNESSYVKDGTINNNFGTTVNGVFYNSTGGYDSSGAYKFDGADDYIVTSANNKFLMNLDNSEFTLSAWINPQITKFGTILATWSYGNQGWQWNLNDSNNLRFVWLNTNGVGYIQSSAGSGSVSTNQWHHVVVIKNATAGAAGLSHYIDGVYKASITETSGTLPTGMVNNVLNIGRRPVTTGSNLNFNGTIDQVQVWNRALSASEVLALYNGTINNSNYIGKYSNQGDFRSLVFYNSTSTYWNTTFSMADTYSTRSGIVNSKNEINTSYQGLVGYWDLDSNSKNILVDDGDSNFVTSSGWTCGFTGGVGYYDTDICFIVGNSAGNWSSWIFNVPTTGAYYVYTHWDAAANRATNAGYNISTADGVINVIVNQETPTSNWYSLGLYNFTAGTNYNVTLTGPSNEYLIADAIYVTQDSTPNNAVLTDYHASTSSTGMTSGTGISSNAFYGNGTQFANLGWLNNIGGSQYLTVSAWVRLNALPGGVPGSGAAVSKYGQTSDIFYSGVDSAGKFIYYIYGGAAANYVGQTGSTTLSTGKWYHLVGVWNNNASDNVTLYVNGVMETGAESTAGTRPTSISYSNVSTLIGRTEHSTAYYLNSLIDEVTIYNSSLTQAEVNSLYKSGLSQHATTNVSLQYRTASSYNISDASLRAFWSFNNDNSTNFYDEKGIYNGTGTRMLAPDLNNGSVGLGVHFNGSRWINITPTDLFESDNQGVFSYWIYPTSFTASGYNFATIAAEGNQLVYGYLITTGRPFVQYYSSGRNDAFSTTNGLTLNKWNHVAIQSNGSLYTIWLNGNKETLVAVAGSNLGYWFNDLAAGTHTAYLGWGLAIYPSIGGLDEIRYYNRTLSDTEILDLYNLGSYHINWNADWSSASVASDNGGVVSSSSGKFMQFKANLNTNDTSVSPYLLNHSVIMQPTGGAVADTTYPTFSNSWDNNATLVGSGTGLFNITVINTNGTVWLEINNTNITATNLSANVYNASTYFSSNGTYTYKWWARGNGTDTLLNNSGNYYYTVNTTPIVYCAGGMNGNGSSGNPCQITNWTQLNATRNNLTASYILTANLSSVTAGYAGIGDSWVSIAGASGTFSGSFNGNGNTISDLALTNFLGSEAHGLFGTVSGTISNLGVLNISYNTFNDVGGIVGLLQNGGYVNNCYSTGNLLLSGSTNTGGLVGSNSAGGIINNSYSSVNIVLTGGGNDYAGGIVGKGSNVYNSYFTGNITSTGNYVGGISGGSTSSYPINNCSVTLSGKISGASYVGALLGYDSASTSLTNSKAIISSTANLTGTDNVGVYGSMNFGGGASQANLSLIITNPTYGNITFLDGNITGLTGNMLSYITIGNNSAYVNSAQTALNKSANVTLLGLKTDYKYPSITNNGAKCSVTTEPNCYNFTSLNAGTVRFNVSSGGNYSIQDDTTYAQFSDFGFNYTNGSAYLSGRIYSGNVTILDSNGSAGIEFNGVNYTSTNISNLFIATLGDLGVGTYNYYWWAYGNGTSNLYNISSTYSYTIIKADSSLGLNIIGTTPIVYGATTDISGSENNTGDEGCSYSLTPSNKIFGVAESPVTFNYSTSGCANYTAGSKTKDIIITQYITDLSIVIKPSNSVLNQTPTNVTGFGCPLGGDCNLYRNGASVSNSDIDTLDVGIYNYVFNTTGNENYTADSASGILTVYLNPREIIETNTIPECGYCKLGYYNLNLPWIRDESCICTNKFGYGYNK